MSGQPRRFLRRIMLYVPLFQPFFLYFVGTIVVGGKPDVPVERALHNGHHCSNIAIPMRIRQLGIINGFPGITILDGQPIGSHP
ncbi:unknown [Bacteroides sp. CAG:633]|nr:unknown [Bacteroides sp. CAG:633]